eukprot:NODE_1136_length_2057_cov_0.394791.p2 type:complete len:135 gc:universal NODE_1136_length_2057_cov_0.394791:109-513(+)
METHSEIHKLIVEGRIREAGYHLNQLDDSAQDEYFNLMKIWKSLMTHDYEKLHIYLKNENTEFQNGLILFISNMLCDLCISLTSEQVNYYIGEYTQFIDHWEKDGNFYILHKSKKNVITASELMEISDALRFVK